MMFFGLILKCHFEVFWHSLGWFDWNVLILWLLQIKNTCNHQMSPFINWLAVFVWYKIKKLANTCTSINFSLVNCWALDYDSIIRVCLVWDFGFGNASDSLPIPSFSLPFPPGEDHPCRQTKRTKAFRIAPLFHLCDILRLLYLSLMFVCLYVCVSVLQTMRWFSEGRCKEYKTICRGDVEDQKELEQGLTQSTNSRVFTLSICIWQWVTRPIGDTYHAITNFQIEKSHIKGAKRSFLCRQQTVNLQKKRNKSNHSHLSKG